MDSPPHYRGIEGDEMGFPLPPPGPPEPPQPPPDRWRPLSVREGSAWDKLAWAVLDFREALALAIAPWLGPGDRDAGR